MDLLKITEPDGAVHYVHAECYGKSSDLYPARSRRRPVGRAPRGAACAGCELALGPAAGRASKSEEPPKTAASPARPWNVTRDALGRVTAAEPLCPECGQPEAQHRPGPGAPCPETLTELARTPGRYIGPAERAVIRAQAGPRSLCHCGHTGDGPGGDHNARFAPGHGPCTVPGCGCVQFTWARFLAEA